MHRELLSIHIPCPSTLNELWGSRHVLGAEVLDELGDTVEEDLLSAELLAVRVPTDIPVQFVAAEATHLGPKELVGGLQGG